MSGEGGNVALAAILDALTLVQGQLDAVAKSNARIEATQTDIMARLDTIDAGQAAVTDLVPVLETILARSIEDRDLVRTQFETVATIAGFAHAAAVGNAAPLPVAVADDPLLEAFALTQPADRAGTQRALVDWRGAIAKINDEELVAMLNRQYQASSTDSPETRVLRYRLAAITRAEIESRGGVPPPAPRTTIAADRSDRARTERSSEIAQLWRAGESTALYGEPELAGPLDLFVEAERRNAGRPEAPVAAELAVLHAALGAEIQRGNRPSLTNHEISGRSAGEPDVVERPGR